MCIDVDCLRKVASGNSGCDDCDRLNLRGEVRGHEVDVVGEIFPDAFDVLDDGLTAELAKGANLFSHARYFRGEVIEGFDHVVDGVLQLQNFALGVDVDRLREVAASDGSRAA